MLVVVVLLSTIYCLSISGTICCFLYYLLFCFCYYLLFLVFSFLLFWTALDFFFLDRGPIRNDLSTFEAWVRSAYTLPSTLPNPTVWNYPWYVVVDLSDKIWYAPRKKNFRISGLLFSINGEDYLHWKFQILHLFFFSPHANYSA